MTPEDEIEFPPEWNTLEGKTHYEDPFAMPREAVDPVFGKVRLHPCTISGLYLVKCEGGFLLLEQRYCRQRFPRLFPVYMRVRPDPVFLDISYVFAPYVPV